MHSGRPVSRYHYAVSVAGLGVDGGTGTRLQSSLASGVHDFLVFAGNRRQPAFSGSRHSPQRHRWHGAGIRITGDTYAGEKRITYPVYGGIADHSQMGLWGGSAGLCWRANPLRHLAGNSERYSVAPGPEPSWFFCRNHTRLLFLVDRLRQPRCRASRYEPAAMDSDCGHDYSRSRHHSVSGFTATFARALSAM